MRVIPEAKLPVDLIDNLPLLSNLCSELFDSLISELSLLALGSDLRIHSLPESDLSVRAAILGIDAGPNVSDSLALGLSSVVGFSGKIQLRLVAQGVPLSLKLIGVALEVVNAVEEVSCRVFVPLKARHQRQSNVVVRLCRSELLVDITNVYGNLFFFDYADFLLLVRNCVAEIVDVVRGDLVDREAKGLLAGSFSQKRRKLVFVVLDGALEDDLVLFGLVKAVSLVEPLLVLLLLLFQG